MLMLQFITTNIQINVTICINFEVQFFTISYS